MKTQKLFFFLSLVTGLFFGCNPSTSESNTEEAPQEVVAEPAKQLVSLVISTQVADFATWKTAFDSHKGMREASQLEDWTIYQEKDNPNFITVIFKVGDVSAAEQFLASDDLKARMQESGVTGEPQIVFYDMEYFNDDAAKSSPIRAMVAHTVQNYDAWKVKFDEHQAKQTAAGVTTVAVACKRGNKNDVTVVATAADFETLQKFLSSPDLKEAMAGAGVIGEPTIRLSTAVTPAI